jgi:fluoride exporter
MVTITELTQAHRLVRPLLGVGVLGGYTTFSTYTADIQQLLSTDRTATALLYLVLTPVIALLAVWAAAALTRAAGRARRTTSSQGGSS